MKQPLRATAAPRALSSSEKATQVGKFLLYQQGGITLARPLLLPSLSQAFHGRGGVSLDVVEGSHPEGASEGFGGTLASALGLTGCFLFT